MAKLFDESGRPLQVDILREFIHHLVGGNLTEDGIQWSNEVYTVDADTDYEVLNLTLDNGNIGDIEELVFNLTIALKAGSATADPKYKWQARNKGGAWVDLMDYMQKANIGTSYVECPASGYRTVGVTNLNTYPIDLRLLIQSNETAPGIATCKVKNSSSVMVKLK